MLFDFANIDEKIEDGGKVSPSNHIEILDCQIYPEYSWSGGRKWVDISMLADINFKNH